MSWLRVVEAYRKKFNKSFVDCQLSFERDFIIRTIELEFPEYEESMVIAAVMHCCRKISAPRPYKLFFECVAGILLHNSLARINI
jgi:hypothetical protein